MDIVVTRSTISFYCMECAHTNVKRIDLAGTRSSCDGCGIRLRVPGARLQRPSERIPTARESARLQRSSARLRRQPEGLRTRSRRRRRVDPNEETGQLRRRRRRKAPDEETTSYRTRPAPEPKREGLLVRLAVALRLKRAS